MNLEYLSNELLIDLFEYFPIIDLFNSFFNLNSRFNALLYKQIQKFHLDLRFQSKINLNKKYISLIADRIISVNLSNDDDTPYETELFLSYYQLHKFIHLKSISLSHLRSLQTFNQIVSQCRYLSHLKLINSFLSINEIDGQNLFNSIWNLPKITYVYLEISYPYNKTFPNPTIICPTLKCFIIQDNTYCFSSLLDLCSHTISLNSLSINFLDESNQINLIFPILSITRLNIFFKNSSNNLVYLLRNLPNLYKFKFKSNNLCIDGYQWEKMIKEYLPKLKIFQFKMQSSFLRGSNAEIELNKIFDSFRSEFWINERQWFIRCHRYHSNRLFKLNAIEIHSIPYAFKHFPNPHYCISIESTSPYDKEYFLYDRVISLSYGSSFFMNPILSRIRFNNIEHLSLLLPFNNEFLLIVSKFDRLKSLSVSLDKNKNINNVQSHFQFLLDRATNLRSISFGSWFIATFQYLLRELTSLSIRRVDFQELTYDNDWRCFDEDQCLQLTQSSLVTQC